MPDAQPVRLQRRRAKGFRLVSPNGLPVKCVTRPGPFGNPFPVWADRGLFYVGGPGMTRECYGSPETATARSIGAFREWIERPEQAELLARACRELSGKNVACYCGIDKACHGDVLLEMANRPRSDG